MPSLVTALGSGSAVAAAQSVDEIVALQLSDSRPGVVVAVHHDGVLQFMDAFGERSSDPSMPLTAEDVFAYPALSEVLLGATIEALYAADVVDVNIPISAYLREVSPRVGRITLEQLLTHTAGLDDAQHLEGESWEQTLDRIDDYALVSEPGLFFSRSRHSLPLAARVLSAMVGEPFIDIVTTYVLEPLGMESSTFDIREAQAAGLVTGVVKTDDLDSLTREVMAADTLNGLPVLFTTAQDVITFLSAWSSGRISGRRPDEVARTGSPVLNTARRYAGGVWVDEYRGLVRSSRLARQFGISTGFYLMPETGSTIFMWSRGSWSTRTARFLLEVVAETAGAPPRSTAARPASTESDLPLPDATRWAGTYRNGDLIFELRQASDGKLVLFDGSRELAMQAREGTRVVALLSDGRVAVRLNLVKDSSGRRFLYFGSLVYRHADDKLVG